LFGDGGRPAGAFGPGPAGTPDLSRGPDTEGCSGDLSAATATGGGATVGNVDLSDVAAGGTM